jgi:hypothetical protein
LATTHAAKVSMNFARGTPPFVGQASVRLEDADRRRRYRLRVVEPKANAAQQQLRIRI